MTYEHKERFIELSKDFVMGRAEITFTTEIGYLGHSLGISYDDAPGLLRRIASLMEVAQKEGLFNMEDTL